MKNPNEYSSFTLRTYFTDELGDDITFATGGTLLNNVNTVGEALCYIETTGTTPAYAVTNDGVSDITLDGQPCFVEADAGKWVYYFVRGGLPNGTYRGLITYSKKNGSGQWDPRLATKEILIVVQDQNIDWYE